MSTFKLKLDDLDRQSEGFLGYAKLFHEQAASMSARRVDPLLVKEFVKVGDWLARQAAHLFDHTRDLDMVRQGIYGVGGETAPSRKACEVPA